MALADFEPGFNWQEISNFLVSKGVVVESQALHVSLRQEDWKYRIQDQEMILWKEYANKVPGLYFRFSTTAIEGVIKVGVEVDLLPRSYEIGMRLTLVDKYSGYGMHGFLHSERIDKVGLLIGKNAMSISGWSGTGRKLTKDVLSVNLADGGAKLVTNNTIQSRPRIPVLDLWESRPQR